MFALNFGHSTTHLGWLLILSLAGAWPASTQAQRSTQTYIETGIEHGTVAYYDDRLAGRKTASGDLYDPKVLTMAHPSLPFGSRVRVINLNNHRNVVVRVNDRSPRGGKRIADISRAAAEKLQMLDDGVIRAKLEIVWRAEPPPPPEPIIKVDPNQNRAAPR